MNSHTSMKNAHTSFPTHHPDHEEEHRCLKEILVDVKYLSEQRSFVQAAKRFAEFHRWLETHMEWEEREVLPAVALRGVKSKGAVSKIQAEHLRLMEWANAVASALSRSDHPAFIQALPQLETLLTSHHQFEECLLNPSIGDFGSSPL
jgi:hemerythrin